MSENPATLHLLCGKIASGKSTLAARLAGEEQAILIAEDAWLSTLFADQMSTVEDYVRCTSKLRAAIGPHVSSLLTAGVSVVLDFPANTVETRQWMRGIVDTSGATHQLHVLTASDAVCLDRLRLRNEQGDHPFAATEAQFHQISKHFVLPSSDEGFTVILHGADL